jgi:hypothetical protein
MWIFMRERVDRGEAMTDYEAYALFQPYAASRLQLARSNNTRFAHYTSADTACKVLRSQSMWLRNSAVMNDFSEVQHGFNCLKSAWDGPYGVRLRSVLSEIQPDLPNIFQANFDTMFPDVRLETYLTSISEHEEGHEDRYGRLSMWRAYAPKDGVAFVFNNRPFVGEANPFNAFTSPVLYADQEGFAAHFREIVEHCEANVVTLKAAGGAWVHDVMLSALRFAVQSTKHPAFREEREWRVLYTPTLLQRAGQMNEQQIERIPTEVLTVGGVPQRIYKIPMRNYPDENFVGATAPELIDRVLIGPSMDSYLIAQAIVAELRAAGVENPEDRVVITNIPLRH